MAVTVTKAEASCRIKWRRATVLVMLSVGIVILFLTFRPTISSVSAEHFENANRTDLVQYPSVAWTASQSSEMNRSPNVTIVTAFFNIGSFAKGSPGNIRGPSTYEKWISTYGHIENSVVAYFDNDAMAKYFTRLRLGKPTKVVMVDRKEMWAFTLQNRTQSIFDQPGYPQNHPKSTNAAYVCAMHAKYELLATTVRQDPFNTIYFAWLDAGLFRDLAGSQNMPPFVINSPECHRSEAVAFSKVYSMSDRSVADIMRNGLDWVSGAFLIAKSDVMLRFCADYMRRAEDLLGRGLANHDQSVILSLYAPSSDWTAAVPLQGFYGTGFNEWFYIAYLQRQDWIDRGPRPKARRPDGLQCSYVLYK